MAAINLCDKDFCTLCGACASSCPHNAIGFTEDNFGFASPKIYRDICIECGICIKSCPVLTAPSPNEMPTVLALYSKDPANVAKSSSGGVFYELAKNIINQGGCVYGVISKDGVFKYSCAETMKDVEPMRGSKYVQAIMGNALISAKRQLKSGRKVLFTGTPCQIAALRTTLRNKYEGLLTTAEVICHGVPPLKIFNRCMDMIGIDPREYDEIKFRDTAVWNYSTCLKSSTKPDRSIFWDNDIYMKLFMRKMTYKPICYNCPFAKLPRMADVTLGDFWGIKKSMTFRPNPYGTSVLLINSKAGHEIWKSVSDNFKYEFRQLDEAARNNPNIMYPTTMPETRESVLSDLFALDKASFVEKYKLHITIRNVLGYFKRKLLKINAPR